MVIAIIAILASMLLPALAKARQKARAIVCVNQLKQLQLHIAMYADDNEGWYGFWQQYIPNSTTVKPWARIQSQYTGLIGNWIYQEYMSWVPKDYVCPELWNTTAQTYGNYVAESQTYGLPAACKWYYDIAQYWYTPTAGISETQIKAPSDSHYFADAIKKSTGKSMYRYYANMDLNEPLKFIHNKQCGMSFLDGHVELADRARANAVGITNPFLNFD